jgi:hypothetical protein
MKTLISPPRTARWMKVQRIAFIVLFFSFTAATSWAHASFSRELSGVVQTVDLKHRLIILITDSNARKMTFAIDQQTQYLRDGRLVAAEALKEGMPAQIWYRTPFFGRKILTKVVWKNALRMV